MPKSRFDYAPFSENAKALDANLTDHAKEVENVLADIPDCREKSLALTHLEECVMWARKALREVK